MTHARNPSSAQRCTVIIMHYAGHYRRGGVRRGRGYNNGCTAERKSSSRENRRTSQFREQATAHTVRETTGVKDNECVEPTETAARIRDDDDDDDGLCSPSCVVVTQTRAKNGNIIYVVTSSYVLPVGTATVTIIYNCRGGGGDRPHPRPT